MKYKYIALLIAGCLAGIGGAYMSMGYVSFFSRDMIAGRGWIGMAAESMGSRYSMEDRLLGTDLRYGRFTGRTASDVKSAIPAYSDDSLRGYDDRDRNLFEEKYVGERRRIDGIISKFRAVKNMNKKLMIHFDNVFFRSLP